MSAPHLHDQVWQNMWRALALPLVTFGCALIALASLSIYLHHVGRLPATATLGNVVFASGFILAVMLTWAVVKRWIRSRVAVVASVASEPLIRLNSALVREASDPDFTIRLPSLPNDAADEWVTLFALLESACQRSDAALLDERRAADALEATNRTLSAEIDASESYLSKQTKRLQEAMTATWEAAEAKTRVLTNTSHEIRTPLNGIIGTTELLLRSQPLSDTQRGLLTTQLGAARALLALVDDILQLGRASHGLALQLAPFDVAAEAQLVCGALQSLADARQVSLRVELPRDFHAARIGDRARIRQIMMGLVGNALKFTENGEVVLELSDSDDLALIICVRDTGIGIPPDQFSRIFEAFYQVDSKISRRFAGTGLGLSIVSEIVKTMEGRITVESALGVGSTFCVQLPLEFADPSSLAETTDELAASEPLEGLRVLVVDDIAMNRELLDMQVASLGLHSQMAESGQQAIDMLAIAEFDVVLLDCQMPDLDGYQTAQQIRERWPERRLRIVAVTAHAQPGERERCMRAGMDDYVSKPLAMTTLERLLSELARIAPKQS